MISKNRFGAYAFWVCALSGCPEELEKVPPALGLKISLPKGWVAQAAGDNSLQAGRAPGQWVLNFTRQTAGQMPDPEALDGVFNAEGVRVIKKESSTSFLGYQYSIKTKDGTEGIAMLGFRRVGASVFRCASMVNATPAEVEQGFDTCRSMGLNET